MSTQRRVWVGGAAVALGVQAAAASTVLSACENPYVWAFGASAPSTVAVTVDTRSPAEGAGSIRIDYRVEAGVDGGWMYCNIKVPADKKDWTAHKALVFRVRGDGGTNGVRIGLTDAEGELFLSQKPITMDRAVWEKHVLTLTLNDNGFAPSLNYQPMQGKLTNPGVLDLDGIREISINLDDNWQNPKQGSLNIDCIEIE